MSYCNLLDLTPIILNTQKINRGLKKRRRQGKRKKYLATLDLSVSGRSRSGRARVRATEARSKAHKGSHHCIPEKTLTESKITAEAREEKKEKNH